MTSEWKTALPSECNALSMKWNEELSNSRDPFSNFSDGHLNEWYRSMRVELIRLFDEADSKCISLSRHAYDFDLSLAISLYGYMAELGMTPIEASNDNVWRYIQMKVIPDQISRRWSPDNGSIRDDRFWKKPWRIYLKILWWYVYLSYNESLDHTMELLKYNSSNDISQLVERSGEGFRVEYIREIMRRFGELPPECHGKDTLSHILMMNNIMCTRIDPELNGLSVEAHVDELFKRCEMQHIF